MYLRIITKFLFVLIIVPYTIQDCGCQLNRNAQCNNEEHSDHDKYSKEANELPLDNKTDIKEKKPNLAFDTTDMVLIKSAAFEMGTNKPVFPSDYEGPARNVTVASFYLDKYEVSNQNFKDFVQKTGYKTEAEIFGDSFMFDMFLSEDQKEQYKDFRAVQAPWWVKVNGVYWEEPEGPASSIKGS